MTVKTKVSVELTKDSDLINKILNDDSIHALISDDDTLDYDTDVSGSTDVDGIYFLKVIKDEGECIGIIFIHKLNCIMCEIHINILGQHCGDGNATDAGREALKWIFAETQFTKVISHVPVNKESKKVLKLAMFLGAEIEGTITNSFMKHGKIYDQHILGINKELV